MQIILCKNYAVDEKELAGELEQIARRELNVELGIQVSTPESDARAEEPVIDLSGFINMEIDIEET